MKRTAGSPADAAALRTQKDLSAARQQLGRGQHALAERERELLAAKQTFNNRTATPTQVENLTKLGRAVRDAEKQVDARKERVSELEKEEAKQVSASQDVVEKARFHVFTERLAALEKEQGKERTATLARQTYYNSLAWNEGRGSKAASEADINTAGLPHDPKYETGLAVSGYSGESRTPDGNRVDLGHVAAALDWHVNKGQVPENLVTWPLGNPFNLDTVTLTGDVASAISRFRDGTSLDDAINSAKKGEGAGDWNGDIDGLNIVNRLARNPGASIGQTLKDYYGSGAYQNRVDEFATHSKYILRNKNGVPHRTVSGAYDVDTARLRKDAKDFAKLLAKTPFIDDKIADTVVMGWERWLSLHTRHLPPRVTPG